MSNGTLWITYAAPLIALCGAIAAWIPVLSRKPSLALSISSERNALSETALIISLKNQGLNDAFKIEIEIETFLSKDSERLIHKKLNPTIVSGNLSPKESMIIKIPIDLKGNLNIYSYVKIKLKWSDLIFRCKRDYEKESLWFFHSTKSDKHYYGDLYRIDRLDNIPAKFLPK